jgi:hypothetical protein
VGLVAQALVAALDRLAAVAFAAVTRGLGALAGVGALALALAFIYLIEKKINIKLK